MNNNYLSRARKVIADPQILSVVAAKRAKQLATGARPMIKCDSDNHLDVALLEIAEGLLSYDFSGIPGEGGGLEDAEAAAGQVGSAEAVKPEL